MRPREYETPHLVWRLSEIMDPIMLQCHPTLKSLIQPTLWGYPSFKDLKIGEIGMTEYFKNVYTKCVDEGIRFDEIMKILWKETQANKDVIERF